KEPDNFRTLRDARVAVWGFGSIAASLAPHLVALGARVTGIARTAGERAGVPVVTADALPDLLRRTDVLIVLLPATPQTARIVDATVLGQLPPHAWVVNVGRGATVDEAALLDAVHGGRLGGHLAWGYVDEPPLTPLLARAGVALFGDNVVALRIPALACAAATVVIAALIARELAGAWSPAGPATWGGGGAAAQVLTAIGV